MAKIMVVDDATFIRKILVEILEEEGFEIAGEASTGQEAIRLFRTVRPDLITMDISMPDMDGIAALIELKKINSNVKVIMCSSMAEKKLVIEAVQAGAKDFIVKPFLKERVLETIRRNLS